MKKLFLRFYLSIFKIFWPKQGVVALKMFSHDEAYILTVSGPTIFRKLATEQNFISIELSLRVVHLTLNRSESSAHWTSFPDGFEQVFVISEHEPMTSSSGIENVSRTTEQSGIILPINEEYNYKYESVKY